jgi:D-alanyl-D-alanine carboxypeptidase/D-alanyl-D-alanine-endopeptidase (penicillin-binding protein 4)
MTPASTMKLLVGSTALFTLGHGRRLLTEFKSLGLPDDGVVDDLWLVGGGDPVLTTDDLVRGVGMLRRAGIRAIRNLNVDASAFAGPEQNPGWLHDDDQYDYAAGTSALSLDWDVAKLSVAGAQVYRPVVNIPVYVGEVVRELIKRAGIAIDRVQLGTAPLGATKLWAHPSPTVGDLVHQMFFESDNHIAEQLLRSLGADQGIGSDDAGARAERAFLASIDVPADGLRIVDGSGLAPGDRVSARTLAGLLARLAVLPSGPEFIRDLPRAGIEGTVRHHQLSDAAGRVRAKSGHIDGVNALAGYVQTRHHGRVAFAFVVNKPSLDDEAVERTYDLALDLLSEF